MIKGRVATIYKDRSTDDPETSFSELGRSNNSHNWKHTLIRSFILLIAITLLFTIVDDQSNFSYASENLTDVALESTNITPINESTEQTPANFNSYELIDPSGTVTSWAGYPISGLTISAWQGTTLISQAVTDENGAYNLDLPPGIYDLTAGGITNEGEGQKEYLPQTQHVEVQEPVTVNFQDMLLKNSVYGVIIDENGNPLQYTMAEVYDNEGNGIDDNDAGADGHYQLDLSYYFDQQDPSITSATFWIIFYDNTLQDQEFTIQVNRDEAYRLDVVMQPATILQGTVTAQSTILNAGTDMTSEVILYFVDQDGNEDSDSYSVGHSGTYYFKVNPSLITVHHIGMNVFGYQDYFQPINLILEEVNIHDIILLEKGIIQITVTDSHNQPIAGASVSVYTDNFDYRTSTDVNGMRSFAVEDGDWTISVTYPDYGKVVRDITVSGGGIHPVEIMLIHPNLPVILDGFVTDSVTGDPVSDCYVTIGFLNEYYQYLDTFTDLNGYYIFDSSMLGGLFYSGLTVDLIAQKQDYNPYYSSFILPEGLFTLNINLVHDTILGGSVTNPDGNVVYADVTLSYTHNGEIVSETTDVDEGGYYRFNGISSADDEQYYLSAEHPLFAPYQSVLNVLNNHSNLHNIVMDYYNGSVLVNIQNSQGQGINGVRVSLTNGTHTFYQYTDVTGSTTFQHLPDSAWTVDVSPAGYAPASANLSIFGGSSEQITLILIQQGLPVTMEGFITDARDGTPLPNTKIYFWPTSHPTQTNIYTKTDANGYYNLSSAQFSEFVSGLSGVLDVRPYLYEKHRISMFIGEGPLIQYNLAVYPYTGSITVHLVDVSNNQPVEGIQVELWGDETQEKVSDPTGTVTFEQVGPSPWWEVFIWDSNNSYYYWDGYYYPLLEGEHLDITALLVPTTISSNIGGTVVDDTNNVVPSARVELSFINGNWIYTWTSKTTDVYGKFLMNNLGYTANLLRITISKEGYQTAVYDFTPDNLPINQLFRLEPDLSLTTLVDGYVQDFLKTPLTDVVVDFYRGGTLYQTTYTNPTGYYHINLPVGVYQMFVHQNGYITQNQGFSIFYGNGHHFDYTLLRECSIYGRIVGDTIALYGHNIPLEGATIKIYQTGNLVDSTNSNTDGYFQTNSVLSGEYVVHVQASYYETIIQPFTFTANHAIYQEFVLEPSTSGAIHGYVTDENTGLPISNAAVALFNINEEEHVGDTLTDSTGFYSFTDLLPGYYNLEYSATGYVTSWGVIDGSLQLDMGQDAELNKALEPIVTSTIDGTVNSWAGPVAGATVTLDNTVTQVTGSDGRFTFPVITDWHLISVSKNGVEKIWEGWVDNNEYKTISIYMNAKVLETEPIKDSIVQNLDQIKVRIFEARPDLTTPTLSISTLNGLVTGSITRENDWIIFTPNGGGFTTQGKYTVSTSIPSELASIFEFYYYPITNISPAVQIISPAPDSFFRNPSSITIIATIQNDVGNGISPSSQIFVDGMGLATTLSGRQITALASNLDHGWHTIRALAIDNQGLTGESSWNILVSTIAPQITNLKVTQIFSPYYGGMHIEADINEAIQGSYLFFDQYPDYILSLGNFDTKIDAYWDGRIRPNSWTSFIPPDGPLTFTIRGHAIDGLWFNQVTGSTTIDSNPPIITFDPQVYFKDHEVHVKGSIYDYSGVASLDVSSSGGTFQKSFTSNSFEVVLNVGADGKYTIDIAATDPTGNTGGATQTIWVDTINPSIQFTTPTANIEVRPGQLITFRLEDNFSGLHRDYLRYHPQLYPQNYDVILDGVSIKDQITWTSFAYGNYENHPLYGNAASLLGITGTYDPKQHGYLNDGLHQLKIILSDLSGNEIEDTLGFSSITKNPDITEKDMGMIANADDSETLYLTFEVQENSDRGFGSFELNINGSNIAETPTLTLDPLYNYKGILQYQITKAFQEGIQNVALLVVDGHGLASVLETGFYHLEKVKVPLESSIASSDYHPDFDVYSSTHNHRTNLDPSTYFLQGSKSLYGYCDMDAPSSTLLWTSPIRSTHRILRMGGQLAFTYLTTPFLDSKDATHLSLWMTDINVANSVGWGWGGAVLAYFDDGSGLTPLVINTQNAVADFDSLNQKAILYARHERPWANWAGLIDNSIGSQIGADGKLWKHYLLKIPDNLNKEHLRVVFVWETVNWFQNKMGIPVVSVSSKIDNVAFIKPLVTTTNPPDETADMPLKPTISALFRIPMDPDSVTSDKFYIANLAGTALTGSTSYDSASNWGSFTPLNELGGLTTFMGYVSSDMRTIYGEILPTPEPYTWTFTTRRGEAKIWQEIMYNGEKYCIFLLWGPGYSGGTPGYLSPATLSSTYGAQLLEIQIAKYVNGNYYEVGDMATKQIILQAAQRKAFYQSMSTSNYQDLISTSLKDWVEEKSDTWSAEVLYFLSGIFSSPAEVPEAEAIIKDLISITLGDGSSPYGLSGVDQALSWFSTGVTGATKINDLVNKLLEMKAKKAGTPFEESVVGDVLSVADLIGNEVAFQKELWDFVFKTMWQIEIANQFRSQLSTVLPYTSGDTHDALSHMLSADSNSLKRDIGNKIKEHIQDQTVSLIKDAVFEAISNNPYGKIILTTFKVFFAVASFTSWDDVHADTHIAVNYANAEGNFYNSWKSLVSSTKSVPSGQITVYDVSLPSTAAKLWYSSGGYFYNTMVSIGNIVKNWPTSDSSSWNNALANYQNSANNYLSRSKILIPELLGSDNDIMALIPLIKAGTDRKPTNIYIGAFSPVALLIIAEDGRRIGYDPSLPEDQRIVNDFGPDAFYNSPGSEPQAIVIPAFIGKLTIQAFGVDSDNYLIEVQTLDENYEAISGSSWTGSITPDVYKYFYILLDEMGSVNPYDENLPAITINGVSSGVTYTTSVIPQILVTDTNLEGWSATLNGQPYFGGPINTSGIYFLLVRATDGVNVVFQVMNFVINLPVPLLANNPLTNPTGIIFNLNTPPISDIVIPSVIPLSSSQSTLNDIEQSRNHVNDISGFNWIIPLIIILILLIGGYGVIKKVKN